MKTRVLVALLLLAICTVIYASEDINDPELYWRKTQEMNQLAERFKAETGFTGEVAHGLKTMRLHTYRGRFSDIPFTADADTTAFREACERIVEKLLPYSPAKRRQLSMCRISKQWGSYTTDYKQQVGGYQVEGSGFLMITYDAGRKHFSIGDNTVELPSEGISPVLSYDEAINITKEYYIDNLDYPVDVEINPATKTIAFVKIDNQYELCYVLGIPDPNPNKFTDYTIVIDAVSGQVRDLWNLMSPLNCHVAGQIFTETTTDFNNPITASMDSVEVQNADYYYYSNNNGNCTVEDLFPNSISSRLKLRDNYFLTVHPSEVDIRVADSIINNEDGNVSIQFNRDDANSANVYYHIIKQHVGLNHLSVFTPINMRITTGVSAPGSPFGGYSPSANRIVIRKDRSKYSHVMRHELSHAYTYNMLSNHWFREGNFDEFQAAMDESFAHYFPCSVCESPNTVMGLQPGLAQFENISNISTSMVKDMCWSMWPLNEEIYSFHYFEYPIASAWWSLRSHSEFQNPLSANNVVDTLLIGALGIVKEDLPLNATYRYKPRYFYNILMKRVDDDTTAYPLNPKQVAIQKAYTSRGFHFYPKVQSYSLAQKPRNCFSAGNQVHVNITEAPQNTPFKVYVIRHGDYTYTNGASVSTLNNHLASDFTPIEERTDADGRWSGLIWTIPTITENAIGDYDIIVDFGSPEGPDGLIHYAFNAADVMDGFDGLNGPGFTVYDNGIDVVTSSVKSRYQRMLID